MAENDSQSSDEDNNAYWAALGKFVHIYSATETIMQVLLAERSEVTSEVAAAVFSGVRIKEAMGLIKRIYEAKKLPGYDIIQPAFKQLSDITSARNDILHFGSKFTDGKPRYVTTKRSAHIPERIRRFPVSPEILNAMIADLALIIGQIELFRDHGQMPECTFRDAFNQSFGSPPTWQYKHAPLTDNPDTP